jgi:predicted RecA/RadA family phage recombinase
MFLQDSGSMLFVAGGTVTQLDPKVVGTMVVILKKSGVGGDKVPAWTRGVFSITKQTNVAWAQGAKVYFVTASAKFNLSATGNTFAGRVWEAASTTASTGKIDLNLP